ncbi:MAG: ABC transporter permease [Bacillota bacterium]|jgi:simple sugar transport system permease protein|nr:ABC transporter permease [Eubacteriales bacterium]MDD4286656.1 ABC transporter permease [Eubacteriales bacterium]MDI9491638.1 ABC transporter permease [Bacillota bacterium]NLV70390.1 ABC transporter permease [Clostridiales bacterium]HPF18361.1 ABC transporter permease [Bacillota bacterium]
MKPYTIKDRANTLLRSTAFSHGSASVIAILSGLLFGFIILLISNPSQAFDGFIIIMKGGFSTGAKGIGQVLYFATPLILTGLSVGFAFKTGLFNIGAAGQFVMGSFTAIFIGVRWTFLPAPWHWIVALIGAAAVGGLWALIPGLLKAFFNVHEVISTIMMNYIGMYLANLLVKLTVYDSLKNLSMNTAETATLPKGGLDNIFYNIRGGSGTIDLSTVNSGIYIAIGIAILMYIVLNKTTFGYELKACGFNQNASRYAGINEKRSVVLSMVIAGALAGLGGGLLYLSGANGRHLKVIDVLAMEGFNGIPVALLGLSNPIGIIFSAIFISYITQGGNYLQSMDFVTEVIDIIIACIIYFSAFALIIRGIIAKILKSRKSEEGDL